MDHPFQVDFHRRSEENHIVLNRLHSFAQNMTAYTEEWDRYENYGPQNPSDGRFIDSERWSSYVFPDAHLYVRYHKTRKENLVELLQIQEVKIAPFSLFMGHGQLQHAGAD